MLGKVCAHECRYCLRPEEGVGFSAVRDKGGVSHLVWMLENNLHPPQMQKVLLTG